MLNPFIVGRWNGIDLWVQWTPDQSAAYALRMRFHKTPAGWSPWVEMLRPWPLQRSYYALPIHHPGWLVQAQVALIRPDQDLQWELAQGAEFDRSTAPFRFSAEREVTFAKGRIFAAQVDEFVASYQLDQELTLMAGEIRDLTMTAAQLTGGCQLDRPEHFDLRPVPGVRLYNLAASEHDLAPNGMDHVMISAAALGGPVPIAFTPRI